MNVTPGVEILPEFRQVFNYADKTSDLSLEDWVSILTLCFSPLIAHIIAGMPTIVRRCAKTPSWLDYLCLYNPTTILWRYLAISDRRARLHGTWNAADMAASNALFWTSDGFDGSEGMMYKSRTFCTRMPRHGYTEVFSTDTVKTIIITLQGIQAIFVLIRGILALAIGGHHPFSAVLALDTIFYPLAVLGLLRLFAAPWLSETYSFAEYDNGQQPQHHTSHTSLAYPPPPSAEDSESGTKLTSLTTGSNIFTPSSQMGLFETSLDTHSPPKPPSSPIGHLRGTVIRTFYIIFTCCILGICVCYFIPYHGMMVQQTSPAVTLSLVGAVYIFMTGMSVVLFTIYLIRGGKKITTVIPCISTWWYRTYTLVLLAGTVALFVLAGINTRRTACGRLTLFPAMYDQQVCNGTPVSALQMTGPFGFVIRNPSLTPTTWAVPLDGWCSGTLVGELMPLMSVERAV